jgi:hypothetical protein
MRKVVLFIFCLMSLVGFWIGLDITLTDVWDWNLRDFLKHWFWFSLPLIVMITMIVMLIYNICFRRK